MDKHKFKKNLNENTRINVNDRLIVKAIRHCLSHYYLFSIFILIFRLSNERFSDVISDLTSYDL